MGSVRQFPLLCYCFSWQLGDSKDLQGSYRKARPLEGSPECIGWRGSGRPAPQCGESGLWKSGKWKHFVRTGRGHWPFAVHMRVLRHHRRKMKLETLGFWELARCAVIGTAWLSPESACPAFLRWSVLDSLTHRSLFGLPLTPSGLTGRVGTQRRRCGLLNSDHNWICCVPGWHVTLM